MYRKTEMLAIDALAAVLQAAATEAATAKRAKFGTLADGTAIEAVTLIGAYGVSARIMTLGATRPSMRR